MKEREDAWIKLANLAKSNPQVCSNRPVLDALCRDDQGPGKEGESVVIHDDHPCSQQHASVMFT